MPNLSDIAGSLALISVLREEVVEPIKGDASSAGRRVIIYGPPGNGKTFVAKAVAGELGLGFRKVSPQDPPKDVKSAASFASRQTLVFFDELEWVNYRPLYLEALMRMPKDVLVVGATNYPWRIQSLIGEGFNKLIFMPEPDVEARKGILVHHLGIHAEKLNVQRLAELTKGYTASNLYYLCEWVAQSGQVTQIKMEAAISEYRITQVDEWVSEAKANRDRLDPQAFRPLIEWLEGR